MIFLEKFKQRTATLVTILAIVSAATTAQSQGVVRNILGGEITRGYEAASEVNVRDRDALAMVRIGETEAVRMRLEYDWAGGDLDWRRLGQPGFAQRIQFRDKPRTRAGAGRDYWYHIQMMIPGNLPQVRNHALSLWDFKHHVDRTSAFPTVSFMILPDPSGVHIIEALNSPWNCGPIQNVNGGRSVVCDRTETVARLGSQASFSNRWIDVIAQARWANDASGFYRLWIDGKPIFGYSGNTLQGTSEVEFKFGLYRHHMSGDPGPSEAYYSNVSRAENCEGLGVNNCAAIMGATPRNGMQNVGRTFRIEANDYSGR